MPDLNSYFPEYTGTDTWDQPLVDAWFVPGWTAQDGTNNQYDPATGKEIGPDGQYVVKAGTTNILGPRFPTNLSFVTVTGNYFDPNSSGIGGFLTLYMSDNITVVDGTNTFRLPQRLTGVMNQGVAFAFNNWGNGVLYLRGGHLDIEVFATDQTADGVTITTDSGNPLTYYVTEHFLGGRTYQISVPTADAPGPVDINSLIVAGSIKPYAFDPVNPMGNDLIPVPPPTS